MAKQYKSYRSATVCYFKLRGPAGNILKRSFYERELNIVIRKKRYIFINFNQFRMNCYSIFLDSNARNCCVTLSQDKSEFEWYYSIRWLGTHVRSTSCYARFENASTNLLPIRCNLVEENSANPHGVVAVLSNWTKQHHNVMLNGDRWIMEKNKSSIKISIDHKVSHLMLTLECSE